MNADGTITFRIKVIEPIKQTTSQERELALEQAKSMNADGTIKFVSFHDQNNDYILLPIVNIETLIQGKDSLTIICNEGNFNKKYYITTSTEIEEILHVCQPYSLYNSSKDLLTVLIINNN